MQNLHKCKILHISAQFNISFAGLDLWYIDWHKKRIDVDLFNQIIFEHVKKLNKNIYCVLLEFI